MNRNILKMLGLGAFLFVTVLVAGSAGQPNAAAPNQQAAPSSDRVGVIDFVRIFDECQQTKDLNDLIRGKEQDIQAEAQRRRQVIDNKQVELSAFQPGTPDYESRRTELIRLRTEASVWLQIVQENLEREKFDWTRLIYERALRHAGDVAKEKGFGVILQYKQFKPEAIEPTLAKIQRVIQNRPVIYHVPEVDVTDVVIRRLNEEYRAKGGKKQLAPAQPPLSRTP
ncbi:MAG: OmpH family outer membrane protein [Phycisphaerae bacterium]